jgi:hypothetical protein
LISAIYFFSAISNTYVAEDSPLSKTSKLGTPYILNNEEIISTQFIKSYLFNDSIVTDLQLAYYMNYYDNSYTPNIESLFYKYRFSNIEVNDTSINNLLEYELFRNHAYFLFRLSKNQDYGLIPEYPFPPMKITQDTIQKLDTKDKIFNSQNIVIYKTK